MDSACISSLVVQSVPNRLSAVRAALARFPDMEVLGANDHGKLVVVLECTDQRSAADLITSIRNTDGVLSANLIFQYDDRVEVPQEDSA